ncbi:MAG: HRDC domain-containing protein [Methanotrichaceae archaeon]
MKCKVFNIRLADGHDNDEANLNEFLEGIVAKRILASFTGMSWSTLIFYEEVSDKVVSKSAEEIILSPEEQELYDALRNWRNAHAKVSELQPYIIANNLTLKQIVKKQIKTKDDMLQIKGFGVKRTEKYGDSILEVIESYKNEKKRAY